MLLQVANNAAVVRQAPPLSSEVIRRTGRQVQAVTSYYGMGFEAFTDALAVEFQQLGLPGRPSAPSIPRRPAHRRWPTCCGWRRSSSRTACPV